MRLIDADDILQDIEECANAVEIQIHLGKCNKDVAKGMLSGLALVREDILRKDTAYDVEKVVADIRRSSGNGYIDIDGDYVPPMIETKDAIEIVRKSGVE